jgi:adenine-specific DNA glycosylase
LRKRSEGELFAGLWDLPSAVVGEAVRDALREALAPCGLARAPALEPAGHVRQILTHRELHVLVFHGRARSAVRPGTGIRWTLPAQLGSIGLSSLARKCLRAAQGGRAAGGRSS